VFNKFAPVGRREALIDFASDAGTRASKFRAPGGARRLTHGFFPPSYPITAPVTGLSLPISTAFAESAVNKAVAKRRHKHPPMCWNRYTVQPP
jgi:hypothetical protein